MGITNEVILAIGIISALLALVAVALAVVLLRRTGRPSAGESGSPAELAEKLEASRATTVEESEKTRNAVNNYLQGMSTSIFSGVQSTNSQVLAQVKTMSENTDKRTDEIRSEVRNELKAMREELHSSLETTQKALAEGVKEVREETKTSLAETRAGLAEGLKQVREDVGKSLSDLKAGLDSGLKEVREENSVKLNEIRGVVDEKLTTTLNTRLKESFEQVSKQLESVNRGLGEMQSLSTGVNDLRKVLGGVKNRGTWGEISLEDLLSDILTEGQYKAQYAVGNQDNANRKVDFAIALPGLKDGDEVYLPVDSKFPMEDYAGMQEALESGDTALYNEKRIALRERIKKCASDIREKYINPPKTTDFAVMYLPIESLYAEVLRMDGLAETLQNSYRVVPAGPANFTALLNSLKMGFRTVQIQKNSNELVKLLKAFNKDFDKFIENLNSAQRQVDTVQKTLKSATERSETIHNKLNKLDTLGIESGESE